MKPWFHFIKIKTLNNCTVQFVWNSILLQLHFHAQSSLCTVESLLVPVSSKKKNNCSTTYISESVFTQDSLAVWNIKLFFFYRKNIYLKMGRNNSKHLISVTQKFSNNFWNINKFSVSASQRYMIHILLLLLCGLLLTLGTSGRYLVLGDYRYNVYNLIKYSRGIETECYRKISY